MSLSSFVDDVWGGISDSLDNVITSFSDALESTSGYVLAVVFPTFLLSAAGTIAVAYGGAYTIASIAFISILTLVLASGVWLLDPEIQDAVIEAVSNAYDSIVASVTNLVESVVNTVNDILGISKFLYIGLAVYAVTQSGSGGDES